MSFKKLVLGTLITTAAISFAPTAQADLLIEPHIGYNLSATGDYGSATELSYNGAQYGVKLGYQSLGFMVGLDYNRSSFDLEFKTLGVKSKVKVDRDEIGAFVGYNFPVLVRAWVGHYFSNTTKPSSGAGGELSGSTTEIGVGFTGLPFLSLNAMYRMVKYDESKTLGVKSTIDATANEIVVGVSIPLTL